MTSTRVEDTISVLSERLIEAHRSGRPLGLYFDYDGTLVPYASQPSAALLPTSSRSLLRMLSSQPRVCVGILSGRSLSDLRSMVRLSEVFYSGTCGLELDGPDLQFVHPEASRLGEETSRLWEILKGIVHPFTGTWIERKPLGLTVHYRATDIEHHARLRSILLEVIRDFAGGWRILHGSFAVELFGDPACTKGSALLRHIQTQPAPMLVLYCGNAENDTDAMTAVNQRGGISVGIGADAPCAAQHRIDTTTDLLNLLVALCRGLVRTERLRSCHLTPTSSHEPKRSCSVLKINPPPDSW